MGNGLPPSPNGVFEKDLPIEAFLLPNYYVRVLNANNESIRVPAVELQGGEIVRIGSTTLVGGVEKVVAFDRVYPDALFQVPANIGITSRNNITGVLVTNPTVNGFTAKSGLDCTYVWVAIRDPYSVP